VAGRIADKILRVLVDLECHRAVQVRFVIVVVVQCDSMDHLVVDQISFDCSCMLVVVVVVESSCEDHVLVGIEMYNQALVVVVLHCFVVVQIVNLVMHECTLNLCLVRYVVVVEKDLYFDIDSFVVDID
jgi:hypothetical protein